MRVLLINRHPKDLIGGSEIQCDIIARHLSTFGHEVHYLAVDGVSPTSEKDYAVHDEALTLRTLRRTLSWLRPDVVYYRFNKHKLLRAGVAVSRHGVPLVFAVSALVDTMAWLNGVAFPGNQEARSPKQLAARALTACTHRLNHEGFRLVDGVTSLTNELLGKVPVRRQIMIRDSTFDDRCAFSWPRPYVVWIANLKPGKQPEIFIELAAHFKREDIDFLIVGKIQNEMYRFVQDVEALPPNVRYLGPRSPAEVNGILREALFLVHTCQPEGFGNNFMQAWLQGRPTVTFSFDPDGLITAEGLGFHSGTREQLVQDTQRLIDDQVLRQQMGERAQLFAQDHFNPEKNVRRLERFLTEVVSS
jgi:glycosyltransferase involved in cell wall biosynthesis